MRLKLRSSLRIVATGIALATMIVMPVGAADVVKIGGISVLEGAFAGPGGDGIRGIELAIKEFDGMIAGKKIVLSIMSSSGAPDTAVNAARKLIEQDGVDIIVGPLSGSEGIAIRDFSKSNQGVTFINGSSAAQDATLRNGSENFFRFGGDGAPLGRHAPCSARRACAETAEIAGNTRKASRRKEGVRSCRVGTS